MKKTLLSIFLIFCLICHPLIMECCASEKENIETESELESESFIPGDCNQDGILNILDVTCIQRFLADYSLVHFDPVNAEIDNDGVISIVDATNIQRILVNAKDVAVNVFSMVNTEVADYLEKVDDTAIESSGSIVQDYHLFAFYLNHRPAGYTIDIPQDGLLTIYEKNRKYSFTVTQGTHTVDYLVPGRLVKYVLTDENEEFIRSGYLKATGPLRMINGKGNTFNIRDIGGWSCDGGKLKYELIYRGCEINGTLYHVALDDEQKDLLWNVIGIRDEIDLRSDTEVAGEDNILGTDDDAAVAVLGEECGYYRCPLAPYSVGVNLLNTYQMEYYASTLKRIIADVSNKKACYIHCLAGADRTGTVCALIEALCGVSLSDIEKDYELTSFSGSVRARNNSEWTDFLSTIQQYPGDSFRDKVVYYALKIGITMDEINTLRSAMIDGEPELLIKKFE